MLTSLFFSHAEDGIRDRTVTGVQTCALPIYLENALFAIPCGPRGSAGGWLAMIPRPEAASAISRAIGAARVPPYQIGRASCRERVEDSAGGGRVRYNNQKH